MRKGMWVVYKDETGGAPALDRVGIVTELKGSFAELHIVDERGDTTLILKSMPVGKLRQASFDEIPATRRPPDQERKRWAALGYA